MKIKYTILLFLIILTYQSVKCQETPRYNHYFTYSFIYNPAFLGRVEASQVNMIYRKQWVGLEGAPEYIHAGLQLPLSENIAIGLNASNLEQGLITETSALGALAYTVNLGYGKTLSFGLSVGAGRTALDISQITDFSDPALAGALDKSFYLEGQAGLSLNLNQLNISVSLPTLFEKSTFSEEDFQEVKLGPLNSTISSISYSFDVSPRFSLEPMGVYRMDNQLNDQWQGYLTLYYDNLLWLGGNYADGYGAAAYAGLQVNDFLKVGYSFDFSSNELSAFNSHEVYLSIKIGKKKIDRTPSVITNKSALASSEVKEDSEQEADKDEIVDEQVVPEETKPIITPEKTTSKQEEKQTDHVQDLKTEEPTIEQEEVIAEVEEPAETSEEPQYNTAEEPVENDHIVNESGMLPGYYVVVGAFIHEENALAFIEQLKGEGYTPKTTYNKQKKYHYVYLLYTQQHDEATKLRDQIRQINLFKFDEAWVLNIK